MFPKGAALASYVLLIEISSGIAQGFNGTFFSLLFEGLDFFLEVWVVSRVGKLW